jgi:hypothetical protein
MGTWEPGTHTKKHEKHENKPFLALPSDRYAKALFLPYASKLNMEYGIWNMEYGIWNMEYGSGYSLSG